MNKKQFIYYFNQVTLDESLESQIELLEKMQKVWIPNLIERKTRNYTFCESCKKYVRTKSFKEIEKENGYLMYVFTMMQDMAIVMNMLMFYIFLSILFVQIVDLKR